jgi:hypothetical protein
LPSAPNYPWLEHDDEFEGVGAHHDNPRYTPVDEDEYDSATGERIDAGKQETFVHDPDFPDVDPLTGDEAETEPNDEQR